MSYPGAVVRLGLCAIGNHDIWAVTQEAYFRCSRFSWSEKSRSWICHLATRMLLWWRYLFMHACEISRMQLIWNSQNCFHFTFTQGQITIHIILRYKLSSVKVNIMTLLTNLKMDWKVTESILNVKGKVAPGERVSEGKWLFQLNWVFLKNVKYCLEKCFNTPSQLLQSQNFSSF